MQLTEQEATALYAFIVSGIITEEADNVIKRLEDTTESHFAQAS